MDPITMGLVSAGIGLAKNELIDRPAYEQQVRMRANEARFAPLMNQAAPSFKDLKAPSGIQQAIDYGLTGAVFGKQFGKSNAGNQDMQSGLNAARFGKSQLMSGEGAMFN